MIQTWSISVPYRDSLLCTPPCLRCQLSACACAIWASGWCVAGQASGQWPLSHPGKDGRQLYCLDPSPAQQEDGPGWAGLQGSARGRLVRLQTREGGTDEIAVWLRGCWLQAACQLGPFPRPPLRYTISPSQALPNQWWTDDLERRRSKASQFRPTAACFIGPSLGIIVIELWRASLLTGLWQEAGTAGLHTTTDVWPCFPPSSPTDPILQLCSSVMGSPSPSPCIHAI